MVRTGGAEWGEKRMHLERFKFPRGFGKAITFLLSCVAVFTLHFKFEVINGVVPDSMVLNFLSRLYYSFTPMNYADLVILFAVWKLWHDVWSKDNGIDRGTGVLSFILSALLVSCISFQKFNSPAVLLENDFQLAMSIFCICGFGMLIYLAIRSFYFLMEKDRTVESAEKPSFYRKHFLLFGFLIILIGWLPWILLNYPGTNCPDGNMQLKWFLGDPDRGGGNPVLSSLIMGTLFSFGRWLADANFGFFLYCLFQTCAGAWIFAYSMKKLLEIGISIRWCSVGLLFFALSPFWGTYAQWFEKDLLYAEAATLQAVFLLEVLKKKACSAKDGILLAFFSVLASLLRDNGFYTIVPALALLAVWLKDKHRKRAVLTLSATILLYVGIKEGVYGAIPGAGGQSFVDVFSIPFQQTARYVVYYGDELTEYEREVIDRVLSVDGIKNYDPVISDPVKLYYRGAELDEYVRVWWQMFLKRPGCYVSAFINKGYGYLAPVSQNIEAWIGLKYYSYNEELGIHHVFDLELSQVLVWIWNLSQQLPLVKYLCTPGLYTWIMLVLALLLWKHQKFGALILFVPCMANVLVCLGSPLASAIRYELPTVAAVPLLIGWTYYSLHDDSSAVT